MWVFLTGEHMNCRKVIVSALSLMAFIPSAGLAALSTDDYIEAAWMTTRFFGAQRSGEGPNWILDGTNYTKSFTKDNYNGKDVSGGWFDCGDHVMYGQSQGYASYILALGYSEFTKGFYDLYTGDYTDYKESKDYTRKGGKPNGVRDLLEELRYEADFWTKAAISSSNFVTVKGDGNADHTKWVTAGKMSTLSSSEGGETRYVKGDANDAFTPGLAAAMLAVMARVDPDESNQKKYLAAAKTAYSYAKKHEGVTNSSGFYESSWWDGRWQDGPFLGALELWRTTKDSTYYKDADTWYFDLQYNLGSTTRLNYSNVIPLSVVMAEGVMHWAPQGGQIYEAEGYLKKLYNEKMKNGVFMGETGGPGSFSVRSPAGGAFLYALYSKFYGMDEFDEMIEKNVGYLLGDNSNKKSYVVGFTKNGANAPTKPHHRGYYGNENPDCDVNCVGSAPEKNKLLGGLIAGDFSSGSHNGSAAQWNVNEVCVDMNAPLVGALGYILSKKAPVTMPGEEEEEEKKDTVDVVPVVAKAPDFSLVQNGSSITLSGMDASAFDVQVFDLTGKMVQQFKGLQGTSTLQLNTKGVLQVRVISAKSRHTFTVKSL